MAINLLTDKKVKSFKPSAKPYKVSDGGGLVLYVQPTGAIWWRFRYPFDNKEKMISLGVYPEVSLRDARAKRDEAKSLLTDGIDPAAKRKIDKDTGATLDANTFEFIAREWFGRFKTNWVDSHATKIIRRLERDVFPWIGKKDVNDITAPALLELVNRVEARGCNDTAHRVVQNIGQIMRYAIVTGRATTNPTENLRGAIAPARQTHYPSITEPAKVAQLLRSIDTYSGGLIVASALKLAPLVFVRPGELRQAEWSEIDFEAALWILPAEKMKMRQPHIVPLSRQAIEILQELQNITGGQRFVFPNVRLNGRCMSENTVNMALRGLGYSKDEFTGHGFRAIARTLLDEVLEFRIEWIEHQLAHAVKDANGRAYNRTSYLKQRQEMMQAWSDYLYALKQGAEIVPFKRA